MANEVTFNINLKVNGKDAVQKVTMNVDELRHVVDEAKGASDKLAASLINFNQKAERLRSISDSMSQFSSVLNTLTEESRSFGGAMAAANTMAGKSGEDFARMKDQVADLAKTVPVARRNNWLTMFCFLYIFLKYCQSVVYFKYFSYLCTR